MEVVAHGGTGGRERMARAAFRCSISHAFFWGLATAVLGLDLWSKHAAFTRIGPEEIRTVVSGFLEFRRSLNAGAVFGTFPGRTAVFILASLFALIFVLYVFAHSRSNQRSLHFSLALILAGALGNLYDRAFIEADVVLRSPGVMHIGVVVSEPDDPVIRLVDWPDGVRVRTFAAAEVTVRHHGVVRDFIKFVPRFPEWAPRLGGQDMWPWVFNVADAALVCGVFILLFHTWFDHRRGRRHPPSAER